MAHKHAECLGFQLLQLGSPLVNVGNHELFDADCLPDVLILAVVDHLDLLLAQVDEHTGGGGDIEGTGDYFRHATLECSAIDERQLLSWHVIQSELQALPVHLSDDLILEVSNIGTELPAVDTVLLDVCHVAFGDVGEGIGGCGVTFRTWPDSGLVSSH